MHFYEPGPYEEFVGKISSITAKPDPLVWQHINAHLDQNLQVKNGLLRKRFVFAASIFLLLGFSFSFLLINHSIISSDYYANWEDNILISPASIADLTSNSIHISTIEGSIDHSSNTESIVSASFDDVNGKDSNHDNSKPLINALAFTAFEIENENNESNFTKPFIRETSKKTFEQNFSTIDQAKTSGMKNEGTWSLVAYINPSYSYHTAAAFDYKVNPSETGAWMWGGEVLVKKEVSSYFAVYSGIQVSPSGQNINNFPLLQSQGPDKNMEYLTANTSFGQVNLNNSMVGISDIPSFVKSTSSVIKSSSIDNAELKQRFYYMEIPLILSTTFKTNHIDIEVKLGCAAGVLIDNKFEVISSDGYFVGKTEDIRPHNASAIGAVSFSVPISNQFNLIVEPNVRLNLYPLSYSFETTYPFSASVKFGMGYRF